MGDVLSTRLEDPPFFFAGAAAMLPIDMDVMQSISAALSKQNRTFIKPLPSIKFIDGRFYRLKLTLFLHERTQAFGAPPVVRLIEWVRTVLLFKIEIRTCC
ncbi:hypothetical protein [Tardiphaga alba]|uniref:hypothetical protein n=1 Tax=Tardiphaga alba TaxID=340268 RepID=UPI001BAD1D1B|nr:hypothetical protein [Tardiphaga alba]